MTIYQNIQSDQAESKKQFDNAMSPSEFNEVIAAILQGKYSWACVLILRFTGYNPLHYIPYRTYKRLISENRQDAKQKRAKGIANCASYHPLQDKDNCPQNNRISSMR
jgi:hypothetical protein